MTDDNRKKIKSLISDAGQRARHAVEKSKEIAVNVIDQDDDGRVDASDFAAIAAGAGNVIKQGADNARQIAEDKMKEMELNSLKPIMVNTLSDTSFSLSKFIRITERSGKYRDSAVAEGSIGYITETKEKRYVNVFRDSIESFDITFVPDSDSEFYYVDPTDRDRYIALDKYYGYLLDARVAELQLITQDLGATYFKVTYLEKKKSLLDKVAKVNVNVNANVKADSFNNHKSVEESAEAEEYSEIEVKAENRFSPHEPKEPELKYFKHNKQLEGLIAMRMKDDGRLEQQSYQIKMNSLVGMKASEVAEVEGFIKGLKVSANLNLKKSSKNEENYCLKYYVEF